MSGLQAIALSAVFFAAMAIGTRWLSATVPAAQIASIRHAVGLLAALAFFASKRQWPKTSRPAMLLLRGALGGISVLGFFYAIEKIGAAPATVLNYCAPIYAACFAVLFLKERPPRLLWLGLALSTCGAMLVTLSASPNQSFHFEFATLVGFLAGLCGGAAMTVVKAIRDDSDPFTVFLSFTVVGGALSLPSTLVHWQPLDAHLLMVALGIGLAACVGQLLFTWGMGHTSATAGSAMTQLVPALVWMVSVLLLDAPVPGLAVLGTVLCALGVVAIAFRSPRPTV